MSLTGTVIGEELVAMTTHACPICEKPIAEKHINAHLDSGCQEFIEDGSSQQRSQPTATQTPAKSVANFFQRPTPIKLENTPTSSSKVESAGLRLNKSTTLASSQAPDTDTLTSSNGEKDANFIMLKRKSDNEDDSGEINGHDYQPVKRSKVNHLEKAAPLAERSRPRSLDEVCGQDLVGPNGVLRGLIEAGRTPSMILWGGPGSGKTTIARLIAQQAGTRFVEVNSASTGVAECKKLFNQAQSELGLTGRR